MNKLLLHISLLFIFLLIGNSNINAQTFEELSQEEQKHFFEGYWKYCSTDRDTIFIIKLKCFEQVPDFYAFVGSYLYYNKSIIENNIEDLNKYIQLKVDEYQEYRRIKMQNLQENSLAIYVSDWVHNEKDGVFSDKTHNHANGKLIVKVISAEKGKQKISWSLHIEGEIFYVEEEDLERLESFSVPTNIVMEKMYDLSEFEDKGIFLSPFPTETLPGLKEEKPARLE